MKYLVILLSLVWVAASCSATTEHLGEASSAYTAGVWTAVAEPAAVAGDGSVPVWGVNPSPSPSGCLVIVGRGEGICDAGSGSLGCPPYSGSPAILHYNASDLAGDANPSLYGVLSLGLFDATTSPIRSCDWVVIPTPNGDAWLGNATRTYNVNGTNVTVQHKGAQLFSTMLADIASAFPTPTQVFVYGYSAGGMGAMFHAADFANTWPGVQVSIVSDSGTWLRDPYLTIALQQQLVSQWNASISCTGCTPITGNNSTGFHRAYEYALSVTCATGSNSKSCGVQNGIDASPVTLMSSRGDGIISGAFTTYPGDSSLRCGNAAPYNSSPQCEMGLTNHSPRTSPGSLDLVSYLSTKGVNTYLSSNGPSVTGAPTGFGAWWTKHGLCIGKAAVAVGSGPIQQSGCDAIQYAAANGLGTALPSGCTSTVQ